MALLVVRGLTREFGPARRRLAAVDDVSFSVETGEVVALVGESGSGKTTLARLLLRLLEPTAGTLALDGADVTGLRGRRLLPYWRHVQAVFQDPFSSFNQFFTVGRLMERSAGVLERRPPARERRRLAEQALADVGLPAAVLGGLPHELSGGQRQRVMVARALMLRPRLLIADEPTSMLDASVRVNILNLLGDARAQYGMSVLFITHDLGQAAYVSDRTLVMREGRLVEQGATRQVLGAPCHPYTRRLLADVPRLRQRAPLP
jgi:peptide/nickel transport system ATP-binding protein